MNGIQSLLPGQGGAPQGPMPGQAQAPGQAPMPGMQPRPQGPQQGIQSLTPNLIQLQNEQLLAELMNPYSRMPKFAVLSALDKKRQQQQLEQAAKGMSAQQQNAMQPPGSVAEQLIQQVQQMPDPRSRGRRYAGGGIVAFQSGGGAQAFPVAPPVETRRTYGYAPDYEDARRFGINLSPYDSPEVRAEKLQRLATMREFEKQTAGNRAEIPTEESEATRKLLETAYADRSRARDIPPRIAAAPVIRPPAPGPDTRTKPPARPASGIATAQPAPAPATYQPPMGPDIYEKLEAERIAELEKQRTLPEDILKGRSGIEKLIADQLKAQQDDMKARRKAAEEQRAKAMGTEGFGARELFEIAGAIDPRRGYVMGSLGKGLAGVQTRQATEREAARKEFAQFERDERTERTLLNQMSQAEALRQLAVKEKDFATANALTEKLAALRTDFQKLRDERSQRDYENFIKQETLGIQRHEAESKRMTAKAAQTAAAQRGEAKDITAYEKARLRGQAADDVEANKNLPVMIMRARQEAEKRGQAFDEQAFKQSLIEQRFRYLMGQTSAVPDAGAGQRVIDFSAIK